jgi:hypothetical protein
VTETLTEDTETDGLLRWWGHAVRTIMGTSTGRVGLLRSVALHQAVRAGADAGLSEHYLASLTGLARDTIRKALGKR